VEYRNLGNSGLKVSAVGLGCNNFGMRNDADQTRAIVHRSLDEGITLFDTADIYGNRGASEEMLGKALAERRRDAVLATKFGMAMGDGPYLRGGSRRYIISAAEASLKRLDVDTIDLYQIHWPAWRGGPESASPGSIEEAVGALAKLKAEGKIRNIGASNFNAPQMQRALSVAPVTSLQPPYSLLAADVESSILPFALEHNIGVIVYSPMASGLLSGAMTRERIAALPEDDWRKHSPNFQEPLLSRNLRLVERLRTIGQRYNATPGEVAIAWTLRNPAVIGAIIGVRSAEQASGIAGAADLKLTADDLSVIEQVRTRQAA